MEAVDAILHVDRERVRQGKSQAMMAALVGANDVGQQYARMYLAKDCRLSTWLKYLHSLGQDIQIVQREETHEDK